MIVDRRELHILAFNFTHLDIDHSRSFGVITRNAKLVQEAARLFEADATRQAFTPALPALVISPINARKQLSALIQAAKKELLIYDPEVSDPSMLRLLEQRASAGVSIRVIGRVTRKTQKIEQHKLSKIRLHARCIIRDGRQVFIGSQSLREVELGSRREVGVIFRDAKIIAQLVKTFHDDWSAAQRAVEQAGGQDTTPAGKVAKKVAKAVTRDLPPIAPMLEVVVKEIVGPRVDVDLDTEQVEDSVKDAVKEAVKDAVLDAVEDVVLQDGIARR